MIADWMVDIGPESPEIVVPWERWIDLGSPGFPEVAQVSETSEYPELLSLLALANSTATLSSKVDMFPVTREEVDPEIAEAGAEQTVCGLGSYLDLLLKRPAPALGFKQYEQLARETVRHLGSVHLPLACAEIVVRAARLYDGDTFGLTLYSMGFGPNAQAARVVWQRAANTTLTCLHEALRTAQAG